MIEISDFEKCAFLAECAKLVENEPKKTLLGLSRPLEGRFGRYFVVRHVNLGDTDGQMVSRSNILDLWFLQPIFRFRERAGPIYIGSNGPKMTLLGLSRPLEGRFG